MVLGEDSEVHYSQGTVSVAVSPSHLLLANKNINKAGFIIIYA